MVNQSEQIFTQEDTEILSQLRSSSDGINKFWKKTKKPMKVKVNLSYLQLPYFLPAKDRINWVPPDSRRAKPNHQLSRQQESTKIGSVKYHNSLNQPNKLKKTKEVNNMVYKREPLEEEEMDALRRACKTFEESLIINVLLETGMRVSELAKLRKEDISWQRNCITTIGKGNKRRVIPMSSKTMFYLSEYFKDHHKLSFGSRWIQKIVKRIAEKAQIMKKVSPHVLRHTFAVCYLHKGGNVRALQGILGHSHIQTTDVYLNYSGTRVLEDFNRIWEVQK